MSYIRADNDDEQAHFDFLEDLRRSGDTNMFGASPYLQTAFGLSLDKSREVLSKWMKLHDDKSRLLTAPLTLTKTTVELKTVAKVRNKVRIRKHAQK